MNIGMVFVRKFIIIISLLFIFSMVASAQEAEKKEYVQENDSVVSVINDSDMPAAQKPYTSDNKQSQSQENTNKPQQARPSKPVSSPVLQSNTPQTSEITAIDTKTIPAASPAPAGKNSSLDKDSTASATITKPAIDTHAECRDE